MKFCVHIIDEQVIGQEHYGMENDKFPSLDVSVVSFPDPAFKLDKGLAHFARNLGLLDLAGKE